jgi:D-alanine-D-alanine ligase
MEHNLGHVGVLMGGYSSEREISLKSGKAVNDSLVGYGLNVTAIDIVDQEEDKIAAAIKKSKIDVAFITLHGKLGEDGTIQSILERLNIPYTGSGVEASQLALNKAKAQVVFRQNGLPVAPHSILTKENISDFYQTSSELGLPLVVKPACEGSSIGVTIVHKEEEWMAALEKAFSFGPQVLVEQFIQGREVTVSLLGHEALPIIEIRPKDGFFDFDAKYQSQVTEYIVPAELAPEKAKEIQQIALKAFDVLGCQDFGRVDLMLDEKLKPYILEVNTIPGFTQTSLLPKAAKQKGYSFSDLCLKLLSLAYGKKKTGQRFSFDR